MRDHHRRYMGEKRQFHYREHRSRHRDGKRYDRRQCGYTNDATPGVIVPLERNGGRGRDGDDSRRDARRENRRSGTDQWQGGTGDDARAISVPPQRVQYQSEPQSAPPERQSRESRPERARSQPLRQRVPEGGAERAD